MQIIGSTNNLQNIGPQTAQALPEESGFSFFDVLDVVNPLQHIPIVSDIYRAVTGDTMGSVANVVGSTVFGGPVGGAIALANELAEGIFGDEPPAQLATAKSVTQDISAAKSASDTYKNMRVTTEDWLNPKFNSFA